jgi:hypothetical protein
MAEGMTPEKKERLKMLADDIERMATTPYRRRSITKMSKAKRRNSVRRSSVDDGIVKGRRRNVLDRVTMLGVFELEDVDLAKKVIRRQLQYGMEGPPDNKHQALPMQAAKTVLEYEYGKPRQMVQVEGDGLKQTVQVVVASGLNPEVYGNGSGSSE